MADETFVISESAFLAAYAVVCSGVLGLLLGSFANVVIFRVPAGVSIVKPPSACPNCHNRIRSRDNLPVLGWLLLHGKCRDCQAPISARYPLVEAGTGVLFTVVALRFGLYPALAPYLTFAFFAVVLTMIDVDTFRLPTPVIYWFAGLGTALLVVASFTEPPRGGSLLRAGEGAAIMFAVYLLAFVGSRGRGMGFGDVRLAPVLGAFMAYLGWGQLAVGGLSAFLYGSVLGIALVLFRDAGRKTRIPFGPFMLAGALTGILVGGQAFHAYLHLFGIDQSL